MTKDSVINFTIQAIEKLPIPEKGRTIYKDSKESGLSMYVTSHGTKTFFIRKRIQGRDERIIIGSPELVPIEKARRTARIIKGQVSEGLDPLAEKRKSLSNQLTLGKHFRDYMELYSKVHKKSWKYDEREVHKYFSQWFNRRLCDIGRYEVQKIQQKIFEENGLFQANRAIERLKAIYNKAIEWGWEGINPAAKIKRYKEKSRDRFILPAEMPCIIQSLNDELNTTARDLFWMLLLTGARKTNTLMMRWDQINWEHQTWRIPDSKNGETLILPLQERAMDILTRRKDNAKSDWVFPSDTNYYNHFVNVKRAWKRTLQRATIYYWSNDEQISLIVEECRENMQNEWMVDSWFKAITKRAKEQKLMLPTGLMDIRLHDIRRTFGSYQAITGSSLSIIGKSLGHKSHSATQIYARLDLDPVRASIERATEAMMLSATNPRSVRA